MTRYSLTTAGAPSCPMCAAYGVETPTSDDRDAMTAIDDGCTEQLRGVLCEECAAQVEYAERDADPDAYAAAQEQSEANRLSAEEDEAALREMERDGAADAREIERRRREDEDTPTCGRCGCTMTDPAYLHCDECAAAHGLPLTIADRISREAR